MKALTFARIKTPPPTAILLHDGESSTGRKRIGDLLDQVMFNGFNLLSNLHLPMVFPHESVCHLSMNSIPCALIHPASSSRTTPCIFVVSGSMSLVCAFNVELLSTACMLVLAEQV